MTNEHLDAWSPPKPLVAGWSNYIYYGGIYGAIGWAVGAGVSALAGQGAIVKHAQFVGTAVGTAAGLYHAHSAWRNASLAKQRHERLTAEWHEAQRQR